MEQRLFAQHRDGDWREVPPHTFDELQKDTTQTYRAFLPNTMTVTQRGDTANPIAEGATVSLKIRSITLAGFERAIEIAKFCIGQ